LSSTDCHYEVFAIDGANTAWRLIGASDGLDPATELAVDYMRRRPNSSVQITRETFCSEKREFQSQLVRKFGAKVDQPGPARSDNNTLEISPDLMCASVEDLYRPRARRGIEHALEPWLRRHKLCVAELLYGVENASILERAQLDLRSAIQRGVLAVTPHSNSETVAKRIKSLEQIVSRAISRLRSLARQNAIPDLSLVTWRSEIAAIAEEIDGPIRIACAIVERIRPAQTPVERLEILAALFDDVAHWPIDESKHARDEFKSALDMITSEILRTCNLSEPPFQGLALVDVIDVFLHIVQDQDQAASLLPALSNLRVFVSAGLAPKTKRMLIERVVSLIGGRQRLAGFGAAKLEIQRLRSIAARLAVLTVTEEWLSETQVREAFIARSARLLSRDFLDDYLRGMNASDAISALCNLVEHLVGEGARERLAKILEQEIEGFGFKTTFRDLRTPPLRRVAELAVIQRCIDNAGFVDRERISLMAAIDAFALQILERERALDPILNYAGSPLLRAQALLQLTARERLPVGESSRFAIERAVGLLKTGEAAREINADPNAKENLREVLTAARARG